jgi:hypothetical protein
MSPHWVDVKPLTGGCQLASGMHLQLMTAKTTTESASRYGTLLVAFLQVRAVEIAELTPPDRVWPQVTVDRYSRFAPESDMAAGPGVRRAADQGSVTSMPGRLLLLAKPDRGRFRLHPIIGPEASDAWTLRLRSELSKVNTTVISA